MHERWFTDAAANGPSPIHPPLTAVELITLQQILDFASNPLNAGKELMHCLDAAGTVVHDTSTGHQAAPQTELMNKAIEAGKGVRLWHNHPSQDSLSHRDWLCAGISADLEVLALNARGSMFVGRVKLWDDRLHDLLEWLPRLGGDLKFYMSTLAKDRHLDIDAACELPKFTGHVLNSGLANCGLVQYGYCLLPQDQKLIHLFSLLSIVADGQSFATRAINQKLGEQEPDSE